MARMTKDRPPSAVYASSRSPARETVAATVYSVECKSEAKPSRSNARCPTIIVEVLLCMIVTHTQQYWLQLAITQSEPHGHPSSGPNQDCLLLRRSKIHANARVSRRRLCANCENWYFPH